MTKINTIAEYLLENQGATSSEIRSATKCPYTTFYQFLKKYEDEIYIDGPQNNRKYYFSFEPVNATGSDRLCDKLFDFIYENGPIKRHDIISVFKENKNTVKDYLSKMFYDGQIKRIIIEKNTTPCKGRYQFSDMTKKIIYYMDHQEENVIKMIKRRISSKRMDANLKRALVRSLKDSEMPKEILNNLLTYIKSL